MLFGGDYHRCALFCKIMIVIACSLIPAGVPLSKIFSGYYIMIVRCHGSFLPGFVMKLHYILCLWQLSVTNITIWYSEVCGNCQSQTSLPGSEVCGNYQRTSLPGSDIRGNCGHRQSPQISCALPSDFHHLISTGEPLSLQLVCNQGNHSVD